MLYLSVASFSYFVLSFLGSKRIALVVPIFYTFLATWIFLFYDDFYYVLFGFYFSEGEEAELSKTMILAAWSFYLGVCSILTIKGRAGVEEECSIGYSRMPPGRIYMALGVWLLVVHFAFSPGHIYWRSGYSAAGVGVEFLKKVYPLITVIASYLVPFFRRRVSRLVFFLLMILIAQGLNQRVIVLIPALYCVGIYMRDRRVPVVKFSLMFLLMVYLAAWCLKYRSFAVQGVFPNFVNIISDPVLIDDIVSGLGYIFSYSIFATIATANMPGIGWDSLLAHVSPLPGSMLDLSSIIHEQKITQHGPYSALGTISMFGKFSVFAYYFICGFIFCYLIENFPRRYKEASFFCVGFLILFAVLSTQYPLRTITRMIYYSLFVFLFFRFLSVSNVFWRKISGNKRP